MQKQKLGSNLVPKEAARQMYLTEAFDGRTGQRPINDRLSAHYRLRLVKALGSARLCGHHPPAAKVFGAAGRGARGGEGRRRSGMDGGVEVGPAVGEDSHVGQRGGGAEFPPRVFALVDGRRFAWQINRRDENG